MMIIRGGNTRFTNTLRCNWLDLTRGGCFILLFPASGHTRRRRVREELSPGLQTGAGPDKHGLRRVLARMRGRRRSQVLPPRDDTLHGVRHLLSGSLWCRLLVHYAALCMLCCKLKVTSHEAKT